MKLDLPDPWVPGMGLLNSSMVFFPRIEWLPPCILAEEHVKIEMGHLGWPQTMKIRSYLAMGEFPRRIAAESKWKMAAPFLFLLQHEKISNWSPKTGDSYFNTWLWRIPQDWRWLGQVQGKLGQAWWLEHEFQGGGS